MIVEQIFKFFNLRDCERHFELIAAVLWDISVHNSMLGFWAFGNSNSPLFLDFRRKGFFRAWHCTKAFFPDIALLECNRRGVKLANITSNIFFFTISEACLCLVAFFNTFSWVSWAPLRLFMAFFKAAAGKTLTRICTLRVLPGTLLPFKASAFTDRLIIQRPGMLTKPLFFTSLVAMLANALRNSWLCPSVVCNFSASAFRSAPCDIVLPSCETQNALAPRQTGRSHGCARLAALTQCWTVDGIVGLWPSSESKLFEPRYLRQKHVIFYCSMTTTTTTTTINATATNPVSPPSQLPCNFYIILHLFCMFFI